MTALSAEDGWIAPEWQVPWLAWGFGTRRAVVPDFPLAQARQVHGAHVIHVTQPGPAGEGDALVTSIPGLALGIKTADCVPMLMVDLNRRAVAAVHAGWRGTAKNIAEGSIAMLTRAFRTDPKDLLVALGPSIGACCFEVGREVAEQFQDRVVRRAGTEGKYLLDLRAANTQQLRDAGVPMDHILQNKNCTKCDSNRFHSFRRDSEEAGRMWSVVQIDNR